MHLTREELDAIEDACYMGLKHGIGLGYEEERAATLERRKNSRAAKRYEARLGAFKTIKGGKAGK